MSQIDTIRPSSVIRAGGATAVPSGTLAAVTSDNSDATYVNFAVSSFGNYWELQAGSHTPPAGMQRHRIRSRTRIRTDAGTATEETSLGRGAFTINRYDAFSVTSSFMEYAGDWYSDPEYGLALPGALTDLKIGGGWAADADGATALRTAELYVDIDCRSAPDYSPEVRDASGADQSGGTVTDTNQPVLFIGGVNYDDLPPQSWSISVSQGATEVYSHEEIGTAPASIQVPIALPDGSYTALFSISSVIRGADSFEQTESISFDVELIVPPPSPPLVSVTEAFGGYQVTWSNPGGQEWADDYVVAEIWRDDCTGSQRIATVPDGLNGAYLDLAIPQTDSVPAMVDGECLTETTGCDITYRIRYWGYVTTTVDVPSTIPVDLVLGWPGTAASIPTGWLRETGLDSWYPRGASGTAAPSATGGFASHSHSTPSHSHRLRSHVHGLGGNTSGNGTSTTTNRFNGADQPTANQSHSHPLPSQTNAATALTSGSAAPGTSTVDNHPPTREVIWIRPDGTATAYPAGVLGWSAENVGGWVSDVDSRGRFLRGAAAAGNGGASYGSPTHVHTVAAHTHTGVSHDHTINDTGLSGPQATTEAETGGTSPRWLPRHTHPMNVVPTTTGDLQSAGGGTSGPGTGEPGHRRLRVLRNTTGGAQTRIIGLYTGAVADLDPVLTLCDGRSGTPDMRGWFCRDVGDGSVNSTGGANGHTHVVPNHVHPIGTHTHDTNMGSSRTRTYERRTSGDQGNVPTLAHTHTTPDTAAGRPPVDSAGGGTSGLATHVPPFKEAHFVRVDGTVAGGSLPVPELKTSEYASATVPAFTHGDDLDRISSLSQRMAVTTDRSSGFPRLVVDTVPMDGGFQTVSTTSPGEDLSLTIAAVGKPQIDALEELLSSNLIYWSPVGGTPGWFAVGGWTVSGPAPDVKVVQVPLVRQAWPSTPDPEEYL